LSAGAAGDAAKDFLNDVSKQADAVKDSVSKQAETVKQSAAAAVEDLKSQVSLHIGTARFSTDPFRDEHLRDVISRLETASTGICAAQVTSACCHCLPAYLPAACLTTQSLKLANSAVSNIDSLVADVSSNVAAVKRDAGSSSKAAGLAIDSMVTRAIEKGQAVKESLAGGLVVCLVHRLPWYCRHIIPPAC
jgi:hypothetical protein